MNPYEELGVSPSATMAEIEARYRMLLREHHPDLHHDEGPTAIAEAEGATRRLNSAIAAIRRGEGRARDHARAHRATDDQWAGNNPFWRDPSAPADDPAARSGGDHADPNVDWFGNPIHHAHDEPVPCPFCGRPYDRLDDYEYHLEHVHGYRRVVAKPPRRRGGTHRQLKKLRYIPAWFLVLLSFALWAMFGFFAFLGTQTLLALVLWTQTSPRFRE